MFGWFAKKTDTQTIEKYGQRAANKRAQSPDRWDAMHALARILAEAKKDGPPEHIEAVVAALLPRFTFYTDPTITDQEEKDYAFRVVTDAGRAGVPAIRTFMKRSEALVWPLKMLDGLLEVDEVTTELLGLLEGMDTEYQRDPQRKLQVLQALEERRDPRIAEAVQRFVQDVNETARFHAVGALLRQEDGEAHRDVALEAFPKEESLRIKGRVLELFALRGWDLGSHRASVEKALPSGWAIDAKGVPVKR